MRKLQFEKRRKQIAYRLRILDMAVPMFATLGSGETSLTSEVVSRQKLFVTRHNTLQRLYTHCATSLRWIITRTLIWKQKKIEKALAHCHLTVSVNIGGRRRLREVARLPRPIRTCRRGTHHEKGNDLWSTCAILFFLSSPFHFLE